MGGDAREAIVRVLELHHQMRADRLGWTALPLAGPAYTQSAVVEEVWRMVDEGKLRWTVGGSIALPASKET